ncbi:MAG: methyl-accepting chemotaxis protein [Candidatus Omnitrophota bacterium]
MERQDMALKRKRYLINKELQIGIFLKWLIIPVIVIFIFLAYFKVTPITLVISIIALVLFSWRLLILSHRVAGPIYRLEKDLEAIAKGNFHMRIKFRKKDELRSISEGINKILDEMEIRLNEKKGGSQ